MRFETFFSVSPRPRGEIAFQNLSIYKGFDC